MWNQQKLDQTTTFGQNSDPNTNRAKKIHISNQAQQLYNSSGLWVTVRRIQQHFRKIIKNLATFPKNS